MKMTNSFEEWFRLFDPSDTNTLYQMFIAVRDGNSYEPFKVSIDDERMILSYSGNTRIQVLISTEKAKKYFLDMLNEFCGGDIELKYALFH